MLGHFNKLFGKHEINMKDERLFEYDKELIDITVEFRLVHSSA